VIETRGDSDAPDRAPTSPAVDVVDGVSTGRIGRYTVLGPIGQGGMGLVLRALDPQLRREVAIKLLRPGRGGLAEEMQARMLREARAMAALSHPNVVPIYDIGEHASGLYIAMQFIAGANMSAWLRRERPPWRRVLGVFRAAGRGLAAAHAAGLVHRDFKPANVIVGDDGRVRVVDFGLARTFDDDDAADDDGTSDDDGLGSITRPGIIVGTPAYMAPEQFGGTPADARADQYGFCVALYEALYGRLPFTADSGRERANNMRLLVAAKRTGRLAPPPKDTEVPIALWDVIARGLQPDPAKRFAGMPDLLRELRRISESAEPAALRSRKPAAFIVVAVALLLVAVVLASWFT
jgi:serine/threonine protein kinase